MWTTCEDGHRHWGRYGAAGLLVAGNGYVLLQLRSEHVHEGGTWSVPGGALEQGETPISAALREAAEEIDLDRRKIIPIGTYVTICGDWRYTTIIATPIHPTELLGVRRATVETDAVGWMPVDLVDALPLHPGFRAAWEDGLAARVGARGPASPTTSRGTSQGTRR